jgi:hypothetical protein
MLPASGQGQTMQRRGGVLFRFMPDGQTAQSCRQPCMRQRSLPAWHWIGRPETSPIWSAIYLDAYPPGRWPPWFPPPRHQLDLHALLPPKKNDLEVFTDLRSGRTAPETKHLLDRERRFDHGMGELLNPAKPSNFEPYSRFTSPAHSKCRK